MLKKLRKNNITVIDEHYEKTKKIDLENLTEKEFIGEINFDDYYIYSEDKSILFSISWDDFFYLIATKKEHIKEINQIYEIEGFEATETDSHLWDWEAGEIDRLLNKEDNLKKKTWWEKIFKRKN